MRKQTGTLPKTTATVTKTPTNKTGVALAQSPHITAATSTTQTMPHTMVGNGNGSGSGTMGATENRCSPLNIVAAMQQQQHSHSQRQIQHQQQQQQQQQYKNTEIVAPIRRELNDLNDYLLTAVSHNNTSINYNNNNNYHQQHQSQQQLQQQQQQQYNSNQHSLQNHFDNTGIINNCDLDNSQENQQRFCYPVRPIPRRSQPEGDAEKHLQQAQLLQNDLQQQIYTLGNAAIGVVIPTTPNLNITQSSTEVLASAQQLPSATATAAAAAAALSLHASTPGIINPNNSCSRNLKAVKQHTTKTTTKTITTATKTTTTPPSISSISSSTQNYIWNQQLHNKLMLLKFQQLFKEPSQANALLNLTANLSLDATVTTTTTTLTTVTTPTQTGINYKLSKATAAVAAATNAAVNQNKPKNCQNSLTYCRSAHTTQNNFNSSNNSNNYLKEDISANNNLSIAKLIKSSDMVNRNMAQREIIVNSTSLEDVARSETSDRAQSINSLHTNGDTPTPEHTPSLEELQERLVTSTRNILNMQEQTEQLKHLQSTAKQHLNEMEKLRQQSTDSNLLFYKANNGNELDQSVEQIHSDMSALVNRMKYLTTFIQHQNELSSLLGDDGPECLAEQEALERKLEDLRQQRDEMRHLVSELQDVNRSAEESAKEVRRRQYEQEKDIVEPKSKSSISSPIKITSKIFNQDTKTIEQNQLERAIPVPVECARLVPIELVQSQCPSNHDSNHDECSVEESHHQEYVCATDLLQQRENDIEAMKTQLKRLKEMMETVSLIESHTAKDPKLIGQECNRREDNVSIVEKLRASVRNSDTNVEVDNISRKYEVTSNLKLLNEVTSDLKLQAETLQAERNRIEALKTEIERRKQQAAAAAELGEQALKRNSLTPTPIASTKITKHQILSDDSEVDIQSIKEERDRLKCEYEKKKKEFEVLCQSLEDERSGNTSQACASNTRQEIISEADDEAEAEAEDECASDYTASNNKFTLRGDSTINTPPAVAIKVKDTLNNPIIGNSHIVPEGVSPDTASLMSDSCKSFSMPPPLNVNGSNFTGPLPESAWNSHQYYYSTPITAASQTQPLTSSLSPQLQQQPPHTADYSAFNNKETKLLFNNSECVCNANNLDAASSSSNATITAKGTVLAAAPSNTLPNVQQLTNDPILQHFMQTQQMLISSVCQCNQMLWHQQREIDSLNQTIRILQERIVSLTAPPIVHPINGMAVNRHTAAGSYYNIRSESVPLTGTIPDPHLTSQSQQMSSVHLDAVTSTFANTNNAMYMNTQRAHSEQPQPLPPTATIFSTSERRTATMAAMCNNYHQQQQHHYHHHHQHPQQQLYGHLHGYNFCSDQQKPKQQPQQHHQHQSRDVISTSNIEQANLFTSLNNHNGPSDQTTAAQSTPEIIQYNNQQQASQQQAATLIGDDGNNANNGINSSAGSVSGPAPIFMHHHNNAIHQNNVNLRTQNQQQQQQQQQHQQQQQQQLHHNRSNTLNNQVPPGNRANNYWDNFRSYSRQNLLSTNSNKSNEEQQHENQQQHYSRTRITNGLSRQQSITPEVETVTVTPLQPPSQQHNMICQQQQQQQQHNVEHLDEISSNLNYDLNVNTNYNKYFRIMQRSRINHHQQQRQHQQQNIYHHQQQQQQRQQGNYLRHLNWLEQQQQPPANYSLNMNNANVAATSVSNILPSTDLMYHYYNNINQGSKLPIKQTGQLHTRNNINNNNNNSSSNNNNNINHNHNHNISDDFNIQLDDVARYVPNATPPTLNVQQHDNGRQENSGCGLKSLLADRQQNSHSNYGLTSFLSVEDNNNNFDYHNYQQQQQRQQQQVAPPHAQQHQQHQPHTSTMDLSVNNNSIINTTIPRQVAKVEENDVDPNDAEADDDDNDNINDNNNDNDDDDGDEEDDTTTSEEVKRNLLVNALKNDKFTTKFYESIKEDVFRRLETMLLHKNLQPSTLSCDQHQQQQQQKPYYQYQQNHQENHSNYHQQQQQQRIFSGNNNKEQQTLQQQQQQQQPQRFLNNISSKMSLNEEKGAHQQQQQQQSEKQVHSKKLRDNVKNLVVLSQMKSNEKKNINDRNNRSGNNNINDLDDDDEHDDDDDISTSLQLRNTITTNTNLNILPTALNKRENFNKHDNSESILLAALKTEPSDENEKAEEDSNDWQHNYDGDYEPTNDNDNNNHQTNLATNRKSNPSKCLIELNNNNILNNNKTVTATTIAKAGVAAATAETTVQSDSNDGLIIKHIKKRKSHRKQQETVHNGSTNYNNNNNNSNDNKDVTLKQQQIETMNDNLSGACSLEIQQQQQEQQHDHQKEQSEEFNELKSQCKDKDEYTNVKPTKSNSITTSKSLQSSSSISATSSLSKAITTNQTNDNSSAIISCTMARVRQHLQQQRNTNINDARLAEIAKLTAQSSLTASSSSSSSALSTSSPSLSTINSNNGLSAKRIYAKLKKLTYPKKRDEFLQWYQNYLQTNLYLINNSQHNTNHNHNNNNEMETIINDNHINDNNNNNNNGSNNNNNSTNNDDGDLAEADQNCSITTQKQQPQSQSQPHRQSNAITTDAQNKCSKGKCSVEEFKKDENPDVEQHHQQHYINNNYENVSNGDVVGAYSLSVINQQQQQSPPHETGKDFKAEKELNQANLKSDVNGDFNVTEEN